MDSPALPGLVYREMCAHAAGLGSRRALPTTVWLGRIGQPRFERASLVDEPWYDAALRADLLTRALETFRSPPQVWLTRSGDVADPDADLGWRQAAATALARHGLRLDHFFVITRDGWADRVSGESHRWSRVRRGSTQQDG